MKKLLILILISFSLLSCQESKLIKFEVDNNHYQVKAGESLNVKKGDISFSVNRINERAITRYLFMSNILDFLDDYSKRYVSELDSYLILGSKTEPSGKNYLYHFFKKGNKNQGISILAICPYDEEQKFKKEIFEVVKSAHF